MTDSTADNDLEFVGMDAPGHEFVAWDESVELDRDTYSHMVALLLSLFGVPAALFSDMPEPVALPPMGDAPSLSVKCSLTGREPMLSKHHEK